jgi:uncharacterized protein YifE (UPF0438 family)
MSGWIKIHRKILDWEWYDDPNTFRLFMHLILKANHKAKKYRGVMIQKGGLMTGREMLSNETGLSVQQVRTCLERLKSTNEITINSTKQGTIIQVVNYEKYQLSTKDATDEQPDNNQQVTINKNDKNIKEVMLDTWVAYRKDIKKPLPMATLNNLKQRFENSSEECVTFVVNNSIQNGWIGLFWDKYVEQPKQQKTVEQLTYENVMKQIEANR